MMEYYLAIKKNEILLFTATWIDLENTMLSEISQISFLIIVVYIFTHFVAMFSLSVLLMFHCFSQLLYKLLKYYVY